MGADNPKFVSATDVQEWLRQQIGDVTPGLVTVLGFQAMVVSEAADLPFSQVLQEVLSGSCVMGEISPGTVETAVNRWNVLCGRRKDLRTSVAQSYWDIDLLIK